MKALETDPIHKSENGWTYIKHGSLKATTEGCTEGRKSRGTPHLEYMIQESNTSLEGITGSKELDK